MALLPPTIDQASGPSTFIDALLAEERQWTAVDQFSNWHELSNHRPRHKSYRRLIPVAQPKPGQQYAFEVELDKCSGCKACVAACHSLNGLEDTETWRSVGLLVGAPSVQQHVTTACHHCVDPGCLNGCPVLAYDKDPLTGIVRHLDDQCIGCQYCVMKCPYEVPQYSKRLGIVRKCDMCYHRLAVGEAPACVQACPTEAIRITIVGHSAVSVAFRNDSPGARVSRRRVPSIKKAPNAGETPTLPGNTDPFMVPARILNKLPFLPDSPDPALTLPTTRFLSGRLPVAGLKAADHSALRLEPAHWPLVVMLLLSQAAAGLFVTASFLPSNVNLLPLSATATALLFVGLFSATLHLGRPLRAWRAFLGWRTSWLSRELLALNAFAATAVLATWFHRAPALRQLLIFCAAFLGLVAVFASAMVYVDTGRSAWSPGIAFGNFFGATLLLGCVLASLVLATANESNLAFPFAGGALAIHLVLFVGRGLQQRAALGRAQGVLHLNARAIHELLSWTAPADALFFLAMILCAVLAFANLAGLRSVWIAMAATSALAAETIARYVFFVASASKRMPGGVLA